MKTRYILLYLCFIAFSVSAQEVKTRLIITTSPAGAYIFIDGKLEGRGKLEIDILAGKYNICVKESLLKWTGSEATDVITASGENKIEKHYSLEKQVLLNSEPQNAGVFSRDSVIGYTPLLLYSSVKNVTLLKPNYGPRNIDINPSGKNEIDLGTPINGNNKSFVKSIWFKVLIGSAAVLGTVAAYHKIHADKKYDEYLINKNSSILSEVNRYDNISGVALGALQINFGVLLYFLLTE
jgi:hypothetical protein